MGKTTLYLRRDADVPMNGATDLITARQRHVVTLQKALQKEPLLQGHHVDRRIFSLTIDLTYGIRAGIAKLLREKYPELTTEQPPLSTW